KEIVLEANPQYFAGGPSLGELRFRIYQNIQWEAIYQDFRDGRLEHAFIPSDYYDALVNDPDRSDAAKVVSKPGLNLVYVGMNLNVPPFDDLRIRQAISHAVDTDSIVKTITRRGAVPARGILPPGLAGYDPGFNSYPYNPAAARRLLQEAGYPDGQGFPSIEIWTVSRSDSVHRELEAYRDYLAQVGLKVIPRVAGSWKEFIEAISSGQAAMFYAAWYADYPDPDNFFYPLSHSDSSTNRTGYQDPHVDRLLELARRETDYLQRADLYRDVQKLIMFNAPLISQHVNSNSYIFREDVQGIEMNQLGTTYLPFRKLSLDGAALSSGLQDGAAPTGIVTAHR
ncbi:MAG: ABC transporter substrate-binding protein, partial [Candidatus Competibacteraceae bacterium]|nr:ABC transporter substrate-binding protein [Candidatus Competibacteraceae bacterium]